MTGNKAYWSVTECCWVASPGVPDALATPWSGHGLKTLAGVPHPQDADDVLRTRSRGPLPAQRPAAAREVPASRS